MPVCNLANLNPLNHRGIELHQEHAMSPLSAFTRLGAAAAALALSGCYYPYGYYPYGANGYYATTPGAAQTSVPVTASGEPAGALSQHNPIPAPPPPSVTTSGGYVVPSTAPVAASQQVYVPAPAVAPAYSAYPYAAYPYAGPSVSIGFGGYWGGGCCWGGGWHGGWGGGWHGGGGHWH
jgi:hypothetical protein